MTDDAITRGGLGSLVSPLYICDGPSEMQNTQSDCCSNFYCVYWPYWLASQWAQYLWPRSVGGGGVGGGWLEGWTIHLPMCWVFSRVIQFFRITAECVEHWDCITSIVEHEHFQLGCKESNSRCCCKITWPTTIWNLNIVYPNHTWNQGVVSQKHCHTLTKRMLHETWASIARAQAYAVRTVLCQVYIILHYIIFMKTILLISLLMCR